MAAFEPRDGNWRARVEDSFARQAFMEHIGARLTHLAPGEVDIEATYDSTLTQQHGFFHAGVTTTIADSAAGYAAYSLFEEGSSVLTTELKINLLAPAMGDRLVARGRVIKPGRTLTICRGDVYGITDGRERHVATALFTMMQMAGMSDDGRAGEGRR
ncbi:PaaI family thioesterase [Stappia sp. F7233]|uniref:Medium/long-chain acyl-CoA thioesterase YigI n=1 Tax=Stappia albiluteola TaxID=2758565 RepID=A0A839AEG6_9HYPH|nr:PaaI family thioesterase [Stappia albiluteola]MBA5777961.1 PaaI family thioesterase [Stappia albiluteola]